jgi:hypothetical protein
MCHLSSRALLLFEPCSTAAFHVFSKLMHRLFGDYPTLSSRERRIGFFKREDNLEAVAFPLNPHFKRLFYGGLFAREAATLDRHARERLCLGREFDFHVHIASQ